MSNTETQKAGLNMQNLLHAAATFSYEIAESIKESNSKNALALESVLSSDPTTEFHVSVCLTPFKRVVLSVVNQGKQYIVYDAEINDETGVTH